jgi:hypothetical protein
MLLQSCLHNDALPGREGESARRPDSIDRITVTSHWHLPMRAICRIITSRTVGKIATPQVGLDITDKRHTTAIT